jgi:hypothetical protein
MNSLSGFFGSSLSAVISYLPAIVVLAAQWVGVMAMRNERNGAWWTMMVGTAMTTLGALGTAICMVLVYSNLSSSRMILFFAISGIYILGGLIFAYGFAMHGLRRKAARERELQFESITAAMAEELRISQRDHRSSNLK